MAVRTNKQRSVELHDYAMTPSPDVPRSVFNLSHGKKLAFNFSDLVPILCEFTLPGDTWNCRFNMAARTSVPVVPVADNWRWTAFSFFIPMRLVWVFANRFWGEQENPGDSINYTIPICSSPASGYAVGSLQDYLGLPTVGQLSPGTNYTHNNLPLRCYNLVWNEWFRDENLQNSVPNPNGAGPDAQAQFVLLQRGKRFDLITQALPWPQKGNTAISLPIGASAPVVYDPAVVTGDAIRVNALGSTTTFRNINTGAVLNNPTVFSATSGPAAANLLVDLAAATGTTLNAFRNAVALQQYLERDARMGTRYTEFVWGMYKVRTADARLNRPEFIGSGGGDIITTPIPQTSATGLTGGTTPAGNLAATGAAGGGGSFTYSATEHGYILVLIAATTDITYQQGVRRMWNISTRYDIPVPLLANLGEQAMYNREVYADGTSTDTDVFGYVPRFDEYRSIPSSIHGIYKSTAAGTIDYWHSSQRFASLPTLNSTFITDAAKTVVQRNFSAGATSLGQQIQADIYFDIKTARPLPLYGIPGLTRL